VAYVKVVLELVIEMYQIDFDFGIPIKHNVSQFKTMANKLKPFGIRPGEPELTLIILANFQYAKEQDWGQNSKAMTKSMMQH
jgi:hypothetical protein